MLNVGRIARSVLPGGIYSWLRATKGDYPMQNFDALQAELEGRAKLVIGDIREIHDLESVFNDTAPLGFASIDVDIYSSTRSILELLASTPQRFLMPTVQLHFDDVWSEWGYNKYAGELLAIEEFNTLTDVRKIDSDRYVDYWHGGRNPWHASMFMLHVLDHSLRLKPNSGRPKVISE